MKLVQCPNCLRDVGIKAGRYRYHQMDTALRFRCPMSDMLLPPEGDSPAAFEKRAKLVADLACHLQDQDPGAVWHYLTALTGGELQRLLMVALAAVPVDRTETELWGWVELLPAAQLKEAG